MYRHDTIAAISTPTGVGGIAVVRLSGPDALSIAASHLSPQPLPYIGEGDRPSGGGGVPLYTYHLPLPERQAVHCTFHSSSPTLGEGDLSVAKGEEYIDDIVATYFPTGYTGEPTVEFSCHGSLYVQQAILQALVHSGARLAEAGEFTMRAFLNGRLNLSQAEAVADLIDAVTPAQHRLATSQLRGGYAQKLKELRRQLLDLSSLLELELDFSQEDVQFADRTKLKELLSTLNSQLSTLISSFSLGNALKRGIPVAIIGAPNAGKSTLLNALLDDDRAIVSATPGTTRDTIEETLTIDGITFRIIDTAGLRTSDDDIETLGIQRSRRAVNEASLVLYLHDSTQAWSQPPLDLSGKKTILLFTKSDLPPAPAQLQNSSPKIGEGDPSVARGEEYELNSEGDRPSGGGGVQPPFTSHLAISAKTREGLDTLKASMVASVRDDMRGDDTLLSNPRHLEALQRVQQALQSVDQGLVDGTPTDLVAIDLRDALYHLGTITGEVTNNEILGNIFSRFCVGK